MQRDLGARRGEPPDDQPSSPRGCVLRALPARRPRSLCAADVAGKELREEEIRSGELTRHAERVGSRQLERLLRTAARLVEVVQLAIRERGVVQQTTRVLAELT